MVKKKKENGFVEFMKQLGYVVAPVVGVAVISHYVFNNPFYTKIAVGVALIILYLLRIEIKLWRLEKNGLN